MNLDELKLRLKITGNEQDDYLTVALEDAIDYVKTECKNEFIDGFPSGVKQAIAKLVKSYQENSNIQSQSLGDMSKSFFQGGTMNEIQNLLAPYRKKKVRFL
ncbi:TPA: head-tail connector protein [Bacillus paranthracis]